MAVMMSMMMIILVMVMMVVMIVMMVMVMMMMMVMTVTTIMMLLEQTITHKVPFGEACPAMLQCVALRCTYAQTSCTHVLEQCVDLRSRIVHMVQTCVACYGEVF